MSIKKISYWRLKLGVVLMLPALLAVGAGVAANTAAGAQGVTKPGIVGKVSQHLTLSDILRNARQGGVGNLSRGVNAHDLSNKQLVIKQDYNTATALTLTPTTNIVNCPSTKVSGAVDKNKQRQFTEFGLPTADAYPTGITKAADGSIWFSETGTNNIAQLTNEDVLSECALPTNSAIVGLVTVGPDKAIWFTESNGNQIGRIIITAHNKNHATASITEFSGLPGGATPVGITTGPDNKLWFTEAYGNRIDEINTSGAGEAYTGLTNNAYPIDITAGPDGALWFTEVGADRIGRITTDGTVEEFSGLNSDVVPLGITTGPDGNLWFTALGEGPSQIGRLTPDGALSIFYLAEGSEPVLISNFGDGTLAFTEIYSGQIGRITTSGIISEFSVPTADSGPAGIVNGGKGVAWFTEVATDQIGMLKLSK